MLVGFAGYAQVGKNTAANFISSVDCQFSFADELRNFVAELDPYLKPNPGMGWPRRYSEVMATEGYEWAKKHTDLRRFMVSLGAGVRELEPDAWLRPVARRILGREDGLAALSVTDVRYANEARYLKEQFGALIIYIERPGYGPANDEEERSFREMIHQVPVTTVVNDGTKEELGKLIRSEAYYIG